MKDNASSALRPPPPTIERLQQLQHDYNREISPLLRILVAIENRTIHKLLITATRLVERVDNYSPQDKQLRWDTLALIAEIRKKYEPFIA